MISIPSFHLRGYVVPKLLFLVDGQGYKGCLLLYVSSGKRKTKDTDCCQPLCRKRLFLFCLLFAGPLHLNMCSVWLYSNMNFMSFCRLVKMEWKVCNFSFKLVHETKQSSKNLFQYIWNGI